MSTAQLAQTEPVRPNGQQQVTLAIGGMTCAPGVARVERARARVPTSPITKIRNNLELIAGAIGLNRRTLGTVKQNLFWAFAYHVPRIRLVTSALLNPVTAAAAMALSSVSAVSNSLIVPLWQP